MIKMEITNLNNIKTINWNGKKTKQLYMHPRNATLEKEDFAFKIFREDITNDNASFTVYKNHNRYIVPLDNKITLLHNDEQIKLDPQNIFRCNGTSKLSNVDNCQMLNLVTKQGHESSVEIIKKSGKYLVDTHYNNHLLFVSDETTIKYQDNIINLKANDFITLTNVKTLNFEILDNNFIVICNLNL